METYAMRREEVNFTAEEIYEKVRLCIQPKSNSKILKHSVRGLDDLEVYLRVILDEERSFKVPEGIGDVIPNLNLDELYESAYRNTEKRISKCTFMWSLNILTAEGGMFGASAILFPRVLHEYCEEFGTNKVVIMPSSIHEVIIRPYGEISIEDLNEMVRQVNATELAPDEILADHVYIYNDETGEVEMPE